MSHVALRRVMIRLLHDPTFAAAVYANPQHALAGVELSATERGWLTAQPPAAWRADAGRPARVLAALAEEFPAAVMLATAHAAAFLRSPQFHAAIQERGSLALAFGEHLALASDPRVRHVAGLERAIAEVRRATSRPAVLPGQIRRAPRAVVVHVAAGALALLDAVRAGRAADPLGADEESVLVAAAGSGEVTLESLEPALAALLERAASACSHADLLAEARRHGAAPGEDGEIVARLVADGLLVVGEESLPV